MKDRIKQIMESQHMTQQVFAEFIGIAPATLSGIFTERTRPTINTVEAIKKKIPSLSTDWLLFGKEPMYLDQANQSSNHVDGQNSAAPVPSRSSTNYSESLLDFQTSPIPGGIVDVRMNSNLKGVNNTHGFSDFENMKNIDKMPRRVTEIRVFYDDQTWESFVPVKNK